MFTGIIEEVGVIDRISRGSQSAKLRVKCKKVTEGTRIGDSIAVNGVCLTATSVSADGFEADVMDETVRRSSLASLTNGSRVNLERAMPADGRFGGHIVAGHVDGTGVIRSIKNEEMAVVYTIQPETGSSAGGTGNDSGTGSGYTGKAASLLRYIVEKGSVALDGISLTVASVSDDSFTVSIIPHTIAQTTLADRKVGDTINIETDIIGKYVEKLLAGDHMPLSADDKKASKLAGDYDAAKDFLAGNGFF